MKMKKKSITNMSCSACKFEKECLEREALKNSMERIHCDARYVCTDAEAPLDAPKESKHGFCIINKRSGKKERVWL